MKDKNNLLHRATNALIESNCKTLVAFSNHPDYHDIFVECVNSGIIDELPFETQSVTYADCIKVLEKANNRIELQRKYRRHYQVIANVDGLLEQKFGFDAEGGVDDQHIIPEFAMSIDDFSKQIESESNGRGRKAAELLKQKLYKDAAPKQIKFEAWQLPYSFRSKEEAIDYVMMIVELFTKKQINKSLNMRSLSRFSDIDGMERIINMAIYLGCIDELIPDSNVSYKTVLQTIGQCSSRSEYKKRYQMNYRFGMHIDGLFDYFFGKQKEACGFEKSPQGLWEDYHNRYLAAKTCNTYQEYAKYFYSAYNITRKIPGEREKFYWFINPETFDVEQKINFVYVYLDEDRNNDKHKPTAYVGRSLHYLKSTRDSHHNSKCQMDSVGRYFMEVLHKDVPECIVLKSNLTLEESQYWEDYYCHFYRNRGYFTINTAATGIGTSSAGGVIKKWTYDACYEVALKCKKRNEMKHQYPHAYAAALRNKWIDDYYWFEKQFVWTYELAYKKALPYKSQADFRYNDPLASSWIRRSGNAHRLVKDMNWPRGVRRSKEQTINTLF